MSLNPPRLAQDIQNQPTSLARVLLHHFGEGLPQLKEAALLLGSGRRVLITGMGASLFASIPLEVCLCSCGVDAVVVEAAELLHYRYQGFRDAVVIMVSRSGDSVEVTKLLATLGGRLPVIGITNELDSTLSREANVILNVDNMPDEMVAIQSYTGTVLTLHLLGHAAVHRLDPAREEVEVLLPLLSQLIDSSLEEIRNWDDFLDSGATVYFLGRGPSYSSALEGSLLFNEIAKVPAVGMTAGSFRHGPVELVDQSFRGIIFVPHGRTAHLNLALAHELKRFGGRVQVIGPPTKDTRDLDWRETPNAPETLAPLFEIVPVQVAAMRAAQLRGIPVGLFRYTARVARDEERLHPG